MISKNFKEILDNFEVISENKRFKGNPFAGRIRKEFADEIEEVICNVVCDSGLYYIKGFPGMVDWAKYPDTFPEFRVLNYNSASNFENGFYFLYRLDIKDQCVDLILAQGRTIVDENTLIDISNQLVSMIDLPVPEGFETEYPKKYSQECIMSKCYKYDELDENVLKNDLEALLNIYEHLIPKYLKLICSEDLNYLIELIHKSGKNKLMLNVDCEFENESSRMWVINAGEKGILIDEFKKHNLIAIGKSVDDLTGKTKDEIKTLCQKAYPNDKKESIDLKVALINKFVNVIKVGDYILSYNSLKNEIYLGKCISRYYFAEKIDYSKTDGYYKHCRDVKWLCTIKYDELSEDAKKPFGRPPTIKEIKFERKREFLDYKSKSFLKYEKRNKIYFGAPGTGKSYTLNEDKEMLFENYKYNYERVTFHPDYNYANFVGTYKPVPFDDSISYEYVPGPFMRTLVKALKNPSEPFILIIEEINRANVAGVFGDVFQLLDRDKSTNNSEYPINVSEDMKNYLKKELKCIKNNQKELLGEDYEQIKIPQNMFIWATMNSADQGVFPMDTAFKRRWNFEYLGIDDAEDKIIDTIFELKGKEIYWNELRKSINRELISYKINEDKLIGPFFAFNEYKNQKIPEEIFCDVFKNKILMYLFEDVARAKRNDLFEHAHKKNEQVTYSQVLDKFDEIGLKIFCDNILDDIFKNSGE